MEKKKNHNFKSRRTISSMDFSGSLEESYVLRKRQKKTCVYCNWFWHSTHQHLYCWETNPAWLNSMMTWRSMNVDGFVPMCSFLLSSVTRVCYLNVKSRIVVVWSAAILVQLLLGSHSKAGVKLMSSFVFVHFFPIVCCWLLLSWCHYSFHPLCNDIINQ